MKKVICFLMIALMALTIPVYAKSFESYTAQQILQCEKMETEEIAATQANTSLSFTRTTKALYIENLDSTNEVYVDLNDDTAVADADEAVVIDAGANRSYSGFKTKTIGFICDTGETATVRVEACF